MSGGPKLVTALDPGLEARLRDRLAMVQAAERRGIGEPQQLHMRTETVAALLYTIDELRDAIDDLECRLGQAQSVCKTCGGCGSMVFHDQLGSGRARCPTCSPGVW